jgi:hypothetical protein
MQYIMTTMLTKRMRVNMMVVFTMMIMTIMMPLTVVQTPLTLSHTYSLSLSLSLSLFTMRVHIRYVQDNEKPLKLLYRSITGREEAEINKVDYKNIYPNDALRQ